VRAAIDGEPARLVSPVEFRVERAALRVLLPPQRVEDVGDTPGVHDEPRATEHEQEQGPERIEEEEEMRGPGDAAPDLPASEEDE
jgi:hypothetical protein